MSKRVGSKDAMAEFKFPPRVRARYLTSRYFTFLTCEMEVRIITIQHTSDCDD